MKAFIVDVEFDWGFQARVVGHSKTSPSYDYPPPTTFLGALAESLARRHALGEEPRTSRKLLASLAAKTLAVGVRPLNCKPIKYSDISRVIAYKITSGIHYPSSADLLGSFDAPSRGKTILAPLVKGEAPRLRWFLVLQDGSLGVDGKVVEVDADAFWRIHRIGSKESRVSVVKVEDVSNRVYALSGESGLWTNYSFPVVEGVTPGEPKGTWIYNVYIDPWRLAAANVSALRGYHEAKAVAPYKLPVLATRTDRPVHKVSLAQWMRLYVYDTQEGGERVVGRAQGVVT